jgi:hypothetical protein
MTKKCIGCGVVLQSTNSSDIGYVSSNIYEESSICERCFRIKNYNEYKTVVKENEEFLNILKVINKSGDLVVLVLDLFNMPKDLEVIKKHLSNDILLVLTKRDLLPRSVMDVNLLNYVNDYKIKCVDKLIISSNKNYQFDLLLENIMRYKKSNNVYVVGYTNAGKSTMINKFIYNYSNKEGMITTSMLPSTTIDNIHIKINDELTIIDTPGILKEGSIINYIDFKTLKKISPKKEIRPIVYQIKVDQSIFVEDILRVDCKKNNNITFYMSNELEFKRIYEEKNILNNLKKHTLKVPENSDIVITDLGFIKVQKATTIIIYTLDNVEVFVRKALI